MPNALPIKFGFWKNLGFGLLNLIGEKQEFRIIITGKDYKELSFFWGFISYTSGEKKELVIRGTEAMVNSVVKALEKQDIVATIKQ